MAFLRLIQQGTTTDAKQRVYFDLRDATDAITPETGEAGGQPQISVNGAAWTNTGIGTLAAIGNGRYYADLTDAAVQSGTSGSLVMTRYKSANTLETPGTSFLIVTYDPYANNVTGGVAGDLTGSITGNVGGNVNGNLVGDVGGVVQSGLGGTISASLGIGTIPVGAFVAGSITADAIQSSALTASKFASNAFTASTFAADMSIYSGVVRFNRDQADTQDRYAVMLTKNGVEVSSATVTGTPTITVTNIATGTAIISAQNMSQLASTGTWYYVATGGARATLGEDYRVAVTATVDGSSRSITAIIGRDST